MNYDWSQGGNPDFIVSKDLFILLWRYLRLKNSIFRSWSPLLESPGNFSSPKSNTFKIKMCNSRKYPYPQPHGGKRKFRGDEGSKMRQFPRWWGWPLEIFSPEAPSKIGELLKTKSCSLHQAVSCFTFCRCFKAKTIVSIDDLYLRSAECFFHGLHGSLCNTIVVHSLINLVIYLLLCYTIYCGIHLPRIQTSLSPFRFITSRSPLPCKKLSAWGRGWIFTTMWSCSNKPSSNMFYMFLTERK